MNDYEFVYWMLNEAPEQWIPDDLHAKVDGFFARFGKDSEGTFYFQTARGPVLYDPNEILWYALGKEYKGEHLVRASKMTQLFTRLADSELVESLPSNVTLECEFFYLPLARDNEDGTLTFVTIPYQKKQFHRDLTLVLHRITTTDTGEDIEDLAVGTGNIDVHQSNLDLAFPIDLTYYKEALAEFDMNDLLVLRSLKQSDRARKLQVKEVIATMKQDLTDHMCGWLENNVGYMIRPLTDVHEGYVFRVNTKQFKVVNKAYGVLRGFV